MAMLIAWQVLNKVTYPQDTGLTEKLNQGKVLIKNWHALNWETEERR
jgi:type III restriction enzyme